MRSFRTLKKNGAKVFAFVLLAFLLSAVLSSCGLVGNFALKNSFSVSTDSYDTSGSTEITTGDSESETVLLAPDIRNAGENALDGKRGIEPPQVSGEISTPLMWRVTDPESGGELYLLGSMHAGLEDMCLFPQEIYDAFDSCLALAVEVDVIAMEEDSSTDIEGLRMLVYTDGTKIGDHIDANLYKAASKILSENGYTNSYMDVYCPALWQQVIDEILTDKTPYRYENGVDRYFLKEAKRLGKTVLEIEKPLDVYSRLASLSPRAQEVLLEDAVDPDHVASFSSDLDELYAMWKRGDPDEINSVLVGDGDEGDAAETAQETDTEETSDASGTKEEAAEQDEEPDEREKCYEEYSKIMLGDRNAVMTAKAKDYLRKGYKVFYVVGLAHMVGDDGIVEGLKALGYKAEQVEYWK